MRSSILFAADGTNIDVTTGEDAAVKEQTSVIKIKRDQVDEGKNVWFTSYKGNSTLFKSDTTFTLDGQIIGAGKHETVMIFSINLLSWNHEEV